MRPRQGPSAFPQRAAADGGFWPRDDDADDDHSIGQKIAEGFRRLSGTLPPEMGRAHGDDAEEEGDMGVVNQTLSTASTGLPLAAAKVGRWEAPGRQSGAVRVSPMGCREIQQRLHARAPMGYKEMQGDAGRCREIACTRTDGLRADLSKGVEHRILTAHLVR